MIDTIIYKLKDSTEIVHDLKNNVCKKCGFTLDYNFKFFKTFVKSNYNNCLCFGNEKSTSTDVLVSLKNDLEKKLKVINKKLNERP